MAPGVPTHYYSVQGLNPYSSENEGFLSYVWMVGNQTSPPLVHSLSYGDVEATIYNSSIPGAVDYGKRVEQEFVKMGLRGISVLFASGDWGVGNFLKSNVRCKRAWPDWPASSPFVTSVGGTQLDQSGKFEVVCSSGTGGVITSGGGFADVHSRDRKAPWQRWVVEAYLSRSGVTPSSNMAFNSSGRGYPDLSALAVNFPVVVGGRVVSLYGTSASTPLIAAMVSLLNHARLSKGQSPMGFLNPFLYWAYAKDSTSFNDVVIGDNSCGTSQPCCSQGFSASPGWDAVTGLGTPNFTRIMELSSIASGPAPSLAPLSSRSPTKNPSKYPSSPPVSSSPSPVSPSIHSSAAAPALCQ